MLDDFLQGDHALLDVFDLRDELWRYRCALLDSVLYEGGDGLPVLRGPFQQAVHERDLPLDRIVARKPVVLLDVDALDDQLIVRVVLEVF